MLLTFVAYLRESLSDAVECLLIINVLRVTRKPSLQLDTNNPPKLARVTIVSERISSLCTRRKIRAVWNSDVKLR